MLVVLETGVGVVKACGESEYLSSIIFVVFWFFAGICEFELGVL
jgi:hypothetical protein